MIESFVDLTYRGLALGRRIKLTEVRPTTGYVELAAPMPVGTQVSIVTDDGVALDATVTWIRELVAGADRPPGMVLAPALAAEAAAAWWQARVTLPDDEQPRTPTRSRPVTVRPRTITERTRPTTDRTSDDAAGGEGPTVITRLVDVAGAPTTAEGGPTIAADLEARVTAAAGLDLPRPAAEPATARDAAAEPTIAPPPMRQTGQHEVVDDGKATMIMDAVDPATLGFDLPANPDAVPAGVGDEPSAPVITFEADGEGDEGDEGDPAPGAGPADASADTDKPSASRSFKRRRKRR